MATTCLTWREFVKEIESILEKKGIDPNTEIHYIDVSVGALLRREPDLNVYVEDNSLQIW